jgi:FKBP-type peptidyl-prolyl cis-trans isomerase FkpA
MKKIIILVSSALALASCGEKVADKPKSFNDSVSYAFGAMLGENFRADEIGLMDSLNMEQIIAGLKAGRDSAAIFSKAKVDSILQLHQKQVMDKYNQSLIKEHDDFIKKNSDAGMKITESGLLYKIQKEGAGKKADLNDTIVANITLKTRKGEQLMASSPNEATRIQLQQLGLQGAVEAVKMMSVGSKYSFVIPHHLGFGERPMMQGVKPYEALTLEVELLDVVTIAGEK